MGLVITCMEGCVPITKAIIHLVNSGSATIGGLNL